MSPSLPANTDSLEGLLTTASRNKWKKVKIKRRSGVLAPLFSLYSKASTGIGEIPDLKLLIDWAEVTGNSIIQLLPMNEVGSAFCPYDSISSFALEPMYMGLEHFCGPGAAAKEISSLRDRYPCSQKHVDYKIKEEKLKFLGAVYEGVAKESSAFEKFKGENSYWLEDLALFKVLKERHQMKPWYEWPPAYRDRHQKELEDFRSGYRQQIEFQMWLQWQLFRQFRQVKEYAKEKNVLIKGDLPILVSRDSADVWAHREFFKLDFAAGAPPDMYCAKGQRWGMPLYNWEKIISDSWRYLKEKLKFAQNFYDILRIDHVVGLFRIWGIPYADPLENQGLNGFFDPRDEKLWGEHGRNILTFIINNTSMLLCAEDLGVVPKTCTEALEEFGIPGNDVQRWVKDWVSKHDFLPPQEYRTISVTMLSTHDTTNFCGWWENEAGTVDEALFMRKCSDRHIDYERIKNMLFDPERSRHGRLRWREEVKSAETLVETLGKKKEEVADFIDMYQNTYLEKEKLWKHLAIKGAMREKSDAHITRQAFDMNLGSSSVFCINTIIDWLYLTDILEGDPYEYRINSPGTTDPRNWSLRIPISLEDLLKQRVNNGIRTMISASNRI